MNKALIVLFFIQITFSLCLGQTVSVDMDINKTGIQDTMNSTISGEEFFVQFIGSNFTSVSGYQFKVIFDSTKLQYLDIGQADDPMSGKMNILKQNGGTITGIFQKQANPKCDSILDVAYTINGTTDLSVSGTGLLGIAKFKSKLKAGESASIKIVNGYVAGIGGTKSVVTEYYSGFCKFDYSVQIAKQVNSRLSKSYPLLYANNAVTITIDNKKSCNAEIAIYDLSGKKCAILFKGNLSNTFNTFSLENISSKLHKGYYLCQAQIGNEFFAVKIQIKKG